jgi:bifunctional non-homologous end joining protein LigD
LPFDPMPERIDPCLALLKPQAPIGSAWLFEIKWDGYRLAVHIDRQDVRIITRGGHDWTHRFPSIADAARHLGAHTAILDGEAVVLDDSGRSDFGALQTSLGGRGGKRTSTESILMAFDLLYLDGHDLTSSELSVRRHLLEDLVVPGANGAIRLSEEVEADGAQLLEHACQIGLEGIIAKRRDQPYRSGRTGDWLKIKCVQSESFMIVGYQASAAARGGIGSLLLAGKRGHDWVYVGEAGTGFNGKDATSLRSSLDKLETKTPAVPLKGKNLVFSQPTLIAEIEFRGWTRDGSLRHASYKGLREVQDNAAVFDMNNRNV